MSKPLSSKIALATGIALAAVVAAGVGATLYSRDHDAKAAPAVAAAPVAMPASVAVVESRDMVAWQQFSGRLEAVEQVQLRARIAGQVQIVHFREGALVKKGDLLVSIDPAPFAAQVAGFEAQLAQAQARLSFTKREYERAQTLTGSGNMPVREMDNRANAYFEAQAQVRAAQAALQSARLDLGYTQVKAPISGRIGKARITAGNLVSAGAEAPVLTTLVSVSPIYAAFDADEPVVTQALADLRQTGSPGEVERIPVRMQVAGAEITGHVQMIDNAVDAKSGTIQVRAVFDNEDGALLPGQFARLGLGQPQSRPALLISERAVGTDQDKKFVLVVSDDNKVGYRQVVLGASRDGLRVVESGLAAGERIVVNGLQRLRPGTVIAPSMVSMLTDTAAAVAQR